jgi:transposase
MPGPDAEARRDRAHGQSAVHKVTGVGEAIEAAGATLIYVPKYSPDLNPIELAFSKFKAHLRKAAEHTIPASCVGSVAPLPNSARKNAQFRSTCGLCSNLTGIR